MVALLHQSDEQPKPASSTLLALFPTTPKIPGNDLFALVADFFDWLEEDWLLPLFALETPREPLPHPFNLDGGPYTVPDLARVYGRSVHTVHQFLWKHRIPSAFTRHTGKGGGRTSFYHKQDLLPVIEQWERERFKNAIDIWWLRFFPQACKTCQRCRTHAHQVVTQQIYCSGSVPLAHLRSAFHQLVEEVCRLGSIGTWWQEHSTDDWRGECCGAWEIVLIYLLDRRLLSLSYDELVFLKPLRNRTYQNLTRLWHHRHPDEYMQFQRALEMTRYHSLARDQALAALSLLVLLKHGLESLGNLERPLRTEELQQICAEKRLVTKHMGLGIYLPYPLHADIRVGHVALDDIRYFFWQYAAKQNQESGSQRWDQGPHSWNQMTVSVIEQALAAPVYEETKSLLPRRPETEQKVINPYRIFSEGKLKNTGYSLLPPSVQKDVMTYVIYCHQEQQMALTSLRSRMFTLMHFFTWARIQDKLTFYPHWKRKTTHEILHAYASHCSDVQLATRRERFLEMAQFFTALANLEVPVPTGYHLFYKLEATAENSGSPRMLPKEEIMDRVFHDGVRQLSYDPFSRLALTIQYYCGTRVTETCDLHLFCILEERDGHAYLLIPKGKTKQERPFPIVELGMGPLLEYMDEIIALRLTPEGTSRTLGKTNFRYLDEDPKKARDWHYLFDRVSSADSVVKRRGLLSRARVTMAMQEALLIAAKTNANGLFQMTTYSPTCQHRRRKGQRCRYFAASVDITICPCCSSSLSGELGDRCVHILEDDLVCDGVANPGENFCPKCDMPLAELLPITTHIFRHNSVSRAHRAGVSLAQNMRLHGHQTVPMHLRYLHLLLEDTTNEVRQIFAEKRLRDVRQILGTTSGKIVEGGIAYTVSLEYYLGLTLQRSLKRRTYGIWGGFWAGALAQRGVASPVSIEDEIVIPEDTYEHTVAQYWYEALGLAVSEVAFEYVTKGKWQAEIPSFLDRDKIEVLVQFHLSHVQDSFKSDLGQRLMETDILEQRRFLDDLAEKLRPWWQHLGAIDQLVEMFAPGEGHAFQKQLPPTEPAP